MATLSTVITVSAVDQASGVLNGIAGRFQSLARDIDSNARAIARSTQIAAVQAVSNAVQTVAAPVQNFARQLLSTEAEWSKAMNRVAVATENQRDLEARAGMQSEAAQTARHQANLRRLAETEARIKEVAQRSVFKAAETASAFSDMVFGGISENVARAMLPLAAQFAQAAEMPIQQAAASLPRLVRGTFGSAAVNDPERAAGLSRFTATAAVAAANASGASVRDIEEGLRLAAPTILGAERRQLEREAARRDDLSPAQRVAWVEEGLKRAFVNLSAQIAAGVQNGHGGSEVGRGLASTNARLGALPPKAQRMLESNNLNPMDYLVLAPNAGERMGVNLRRVLPNVPTQTMDEVAAIYADQTRTATQRFQAANEALAQRGGAGRTAMGTQDALKAASVLREQQAAIAERVETNRMIRDLEARGVNAATLKEAFGAYHAPKIAGMEGAEVERIRRETQGRVDQPGYLESQEAQRMAGLYGALEKLTGALDSAKRAFFATFGPELIDLMGRAEAALESFSNTLNARHPDGSYVNQELRNLVRNVAIAGGALVALAPVLATVGAAGLGAWALGKAFAAVAATVATVVKVAGVIAGVFASIPVAIGAAVAALAGFAIFKDLGGSLAPFLTAVEHVKAAFASLWEAAKAALSGDWSKAGDLAMSALRSIGAGLWSLGESLGKAALGALQAAGAGIASWASETWQRAVNLGKNLEADFDAAMQRLGANVLAASAKVGETWDSVVSSIKGKASEIGAAIQSAIESALSYVSGLWSAFEAKVTGWIACLKARLPGFLGGTSAEGQSPAAPAVPRAPELPQGLGGVDWAEPFRRMSGAASEADRPVTTVAASLRDVGGNAGAAAGQLEAVRTALGALSRVPMPTMPAMPSSPATPAPAAATVQPINGTQSAGGFRSFDDMGVVPRAQRVEIGAGSIDVRVRAERGTQAFTSAQTSGRIAAKLDAGLSDTAWI